MPTNRQAKILTRITEVSNDLTELHRVQMEIATSGSASASLSSGGGSKSYTRLDLNTIENLIRSKQVELANLRSRLTGNGPLRRIYLVR